MSVSVGNISSSGSSGGRRLKSEGLNAVAQADLPTTSTENPALTPIKVVHEEDDISVVSDLRTGVSVKSGMRNSEMRKAMNIINSLKSEKIMLQNALERVNVEDITLLKTKLRQSNIEINTLKQRNTELKDRVQILEEKLFYALKDQTKSSVTVSSTVSAKETKEDVAKVVQQTSSTANGREDGTMKRMRMKCNHLQRLVGSYESRIQEMQVCISKLDIQKK
jgi:predicted nuclease with TOPRIM domain